MRNKFNTFIIFFIIMSMSIYTGCWNYREIDTLAIVSGIAIDKGMDGKGYLVSFEIIKIGAGKESETTTELVKSEGMTIFEAVRDAILITGKKLYFSHSKVLIISSEVAKDGIVHVIDFFSRHIETRRDIGVYISREKNAYDILEQKNPLSDILSLSLDQMQSSSDEVSKNPSVVLWEYISALSSEGVSAVLPIISINTQENKALEEKHEEKKSKEENSQDEKPQEEAKPQEEKSQGKKSTPQINGTAIFKKDKLIGFLDGDQTNTMLYIQKKNPKGLIILIEENGDSKISLEIQENKTEVKPIIINGKVTIKIDIKIKVVIGENGSAVDYMKNDNRKKSEKDSSEQLKNRIIDLVKKVQNEYSDIFGFGGLIKKELPSEWRNLSKDWDNIFKQVDVIVEANIKIVNTGLNSKPIKIGD